MKAEDLLARGFFPKEMPPPFTTSEFSKVAADLTSVSGRRWRTPARHTLFRPGGLRRVLSLPHPEAQSSLSTVIEASWPVINEHCAKSTISLTRPTPGQPVDERAVAHVAPGARMLHRARLQRSARYVVTADVSQFYNSVYTHSLPWALMGKQAAKQALAARTPILGHDIDQSLQHAQDGQTIGIPIGPDTSLIAAEVVLTTVDCALTDAGHGDASNALRYMDDFELYFRSRAQAEDALSQLEALLLGFQLTLNPSKTQVHETPLSLEVRWRNQLLRFPFRETAAQSDRSDDARTEDLMVFFSLAFDLRRENPTEPVLAYAVRRAATEATGPKSWSTYVDLALSCALLEPSSVGFLAPALVHGHASGLETDLDAVSSALNSFIAEYGALQHGNEVAWALYLMIALRQRLSGPAEDAVLSMSDNACCLLYCFARSLALAPRGDDPLVATGASGLPDLAHSEDWLFAYEATRRGWYRYPHIEDDPYFAQLLARDISFFETNALEAVQTDDWDAIFGLLGAIGVSAIGSY